MIERQQTNYLLNLLEHFPVVSIIGPRQVGKTTLVKLIQTKLKKESIYLDLQKDSDSDRLENAERFLKSQLDKCVIIDEIQLKPKLFSLIRALVDEYRIPARFIILGSASPMLLKNSAESLAGRVASVELAPFTLTEVTKNGISLDDHWFYGGYPEPLLKPKSFFTGTWLTEYIETFVYRDLTILGFDVAPKTLSRLLSMLATTQGGILNMSDFGRSIGVSHNTVKKYLDLLEGGFITSRLEPYYINIGKRLIKAPKVYIRDSGILHKLLRINSHYDLLGHMILGHSWEGYVIEQIRRVTGKEWEFYFYRTHSGAEADLVLISPNGKKACIEIKYSSSPKVSKGFHETIKDLAPDFKYIIIPEGEQYVKDEDIIVCSILEFLEKELGQIQT
ncbi:ATP-binding protein [Runella rosea]|uniref:ATP-binding protein n=1 Tax=Runella rosea TaxID=2259595 RepID=UPI004044B3C3